MLGEMARTVSHEECQDLILLYYQLRNALFIKGPPAIGKSDLVRQVAQKIAESKGLQYVEYKDDPTCLNDPNKFVLIDLRLAQLDPSDLRGIPWVYALIRRREPDEEAPIALSVEEGEVQPVKKEDKIMKVPVSVLQQYPDAEILELVTRWSPPSDLPIAGQGILFLDEMNLAAELNLKAAYQLILRRCLGEYRVPDGYGIVAAGNREIDMASVTPFPAPLKSRFAWCELRSPNVESWTDWASTANIHPYIIGYLNFKPPSLNQFDANSANDAQPTPRTWEMASDILNQIGTDNLPAVRLMVSTCVGQEAANELYNFIQMRDRLPPVDDYLRDPEKTPIDFRNTSIVWTLLSALAERYRSSNFNAKVLDPCLRFCLRLTTDEAARAEMAVVFLAMLRSVDKNLKNKVLKNKVFQKISDQLVLFVGKEFH